MATSFGAANATAASVAENARKSSPYLPLCRRHLCRSASSDKISFCFPAKPKLRLSSKGLRSAWNCSTVVRAQLNEVAVDESSKGASSNPVKPEASPAEVKDVNLSKEAPSVSLASEESISEFMNQVSNLVKLVDSKDIVELQLKQLDCELLIRKKEALAPPPSAPVTYIQSLPQPSVPLPIPAAASPSPAPVPVPVPTPATAIVPTPPKIQPSKSSHPPLKSPMAGTLYRSPAPGEPPFVQVGSKVQKGQVLCIIEAMKLMNEIEADQSGTIVEILAEDGKPVSVDTPLFVIEP
ncbi:biotin carboxyl carrier protein of acetyl-CoA carboxylase 1, chloroplastic [Henckelia pumila]|uniref:biotin carboxyl carrier protein of acetyl-CoA carboxylase 1, chloroplastic n=1 Tax=Henckelia pumila TaxID=405737 RepID=UPI003C6DDB55